MINPPVRALLDAIGKIEAGKRGYQAMFLPAERKLGKQNITAMTVSEVQSLQSRMVKVSKSSAVGRYQFIRATLRGLIAELGISRSDVFNEALQDRLAYRLLERRGLSHYLTGSISREQFANGLAHEWASLPCIGGPRHGKPSLQAMRKSCYAGDGLNQALMTPERFLALLDALTAVPVIGASLGPKHGTDLKRSRTIKGAIVQASGAAGTGVTQALAENVNEAASALSPITHLSMWLTGIFVAMILGGFALTTYARIDDAGMLKKDAD